MKRSHSLKSETDDRHQLYHVPNPEAGTLRGVGNLEFHSVHRFYLRFPLYTFIIV